MTLPCDEFNFPQFTANWTRNEVLRLVEEHDGKLSNTQFEPETVKELLLVIYFGLITPAIGKKILRLLADSKFSPIEYIEKNKLWVFDNENNIEKYCNEAIEKNPKNVEDYKKGNEKSLMSLVGYVMKATNRTASAQEIIALLKEKLK